LELTQGQQKALKIAVERYNNHEAYTVIAGFAGTGKTTVVKYIIDELHIQEDEVVYIAYTGKASLVLRNKGCSNAMTAHKLLYHAKERPDGTYEFKRKYVLDGKYKVIVLDEASMLPKEMWELLLTHKIYVLALGDCGQLPPIEGNSEILNSPHVILDEVVRQALESPIIRLSMDIRNGRWLEYGGPKECRIMPPDKVSDKLLLGADQILCGKNRTRHGLNEQLRSIKFQDGYTLAPKDGDKVVCLRNQWNTIGTNGEPLVNGMIGTIDYLDLSKQNQYYKPCMIADFISDNNGRYEGVHMDYNIFTNKEPTINQTNWSQYPKPIRACEFDYGYAITVHKSQGSEFERVVVFDEWLGDKEQHKRWLYTAVTRASKMLVIVK